MNGPNTPGFVIIRLEWIRDPNYYETILTTAVPIHELVGIIASFPSYSDIDEFATEMILDSLSDRDLEQYGGYIQFSIENLIEAYMQSYEEIHNRYEVKYVFYEWVDDDSLLLMKADLCLD